MSKISEKLSGINSIINKIPIILIVVILGILIILYRSLYFIIRNFQTQQIFEIIYTILFKLSGISLIVVIIYCFKKRFKPLIIFLSFLLIHLFIPIELITGYVNYLFINTERQTLINNLNSGKYDSLITNDIYAKDGFGTMFEYPHPHSDKWVTIYKESKLKMLRLYVGSDFYIYERRFFYFYISDKSKLNDKILLNFLQYNYNLIYLGDNWYWVNQDVTSSQAP